MLWKFKTINNESSDDGWLQYEFKKTQEKLIKPSSYEIRPPNRRRYL